MRKFRKVVKKTKKPIKKPVRPVKVKRRERKSEYEDECVDYDESQDEYESDDEGSDVYEDNYHEDEEDEQEELERAIRKHDIAEEIEDFLSYRPDFVIIEFTNDWVILAKLMVLRINTISNSAGFQPNDRTQETKKCLLTVVEFGEEPKRGDLAYVLKRGGCPAVRIMTKYDVSRKLEEI